jgi:GNAT superfamily N-acetyltransferase
VFQRAQLAAAGLFCFAGKFWRERNTIRFGRHACPIPTEVPTGITIRPASGADAPGILACLEMAFEPYRAQYTPAAFVDTVLTPESVQDRLRWMAVFVAIAAENQIVGTIACSVTAAGEGHLRGMAVLPEWHGRGIAEALLQAAEGELAGKGCARVTLDTTGPLQRAVRFYEKHGYAASGKTIDFFGMTLFEYRKELGS